MVPKQIKSPAILAGLAAASVPMTARPQVELPDEMVLSARLIGVTMERDALSAQVKQLTASLAESEARAELAAAEIANLRQLCRDMLPVFQAARPLVLNLERLKDAALAQEAERDAASA
jgi:hypothetical protein